MSQEKVTAVVVTYRSAHIIDCALTSLRPAFEQGLLECIVVDNQGGDDTPDLVQRLHPWARVIESGGNLGYGRGCNVGLEAATTPYVMFMNPDAAIGPEAVLRLRDFLAAHSQAGLVAPAIREGDRLQDAGALTTPGTVLRQALGLGLSGRRPIRPGEAPFSTDWLCGALLLGRTNELRALGGFDPRFFLYFEETDLCRRVLRQGQELWAIGEAVAEHEGAGSTAQGRGDLVGGCIPEHYFRSRSYYLVKHWGRLVEVPTELLEWCLLALRWVGRRIRGRQAADLAIRLRRPLLRTPALPEGVQ